jgi:hypothetical protein
MKTIKAKSWLPVFPGFYNTLFEPDEDSEIYNINQERAEKGLSEIGYDDVKFDYKTQMVEIAKDCCKFIERELKGFVSKIEFEVVSSPKEYSFTNDGINCTISLSVENILKIKQYVKDNAKAFETYLKNHYTSYDGFINSYSNDIEDWEITNELLEHKHKLGSVLQFICRLEEITEEDMYYASENINLFHIENLSELMTK